MSLKIPWFQVDSKGKRKAFLFIFVGEPGTGKSTIMKSFLDANKRNVIIPSNMSEAPETWTGFGSINPERYHVKNLDDPKGKKLDLRWRLPYIDSFQGSRLVNVSIFTNPQHMYEFIPSVLDPNKKQGVFRYGGFFVDDMKNYILSKGQLSSRVANPLRARRHIGIDFFFACHMFQDINAEFFGFGAKLWVFKTNTPPTDAALAKMSPKCQQQLLNLIAIVNAHPDIHFYLPFDPSDDKFNDLVIKEYT